MQYMKLNAIERQALLASLARMPEYLRRTFAGLSDVQWRKPGPRGTFAPVEQVWHLADLEREGFGVRIRRLLGEAAPHMPDFDGDRIARERNYRSLAPEQGLALFSAARAQNIAALHGLKGPAWLRSGTQEGVGAVSLCDMPAFMWQHDEAHRREIETGKRST